MYLPIYVSMYLPMYLSIYLSTYLSIYVSIYVSKSIYIHLETVLSKAALNASGSVQSEETSPVKARNPSSAKDVRNFAKAL